MIERSGSRKANLLALVAILGILGTLFLVWQVSEKVSETTGPSALTSAAGKVYFVAGNTLYVADVNGALNDAISLESLGFKGAVSQLAVLDEALLVADGVNGVVQRCDLARRSCTLLANMPMPRRGGAMALAPAPEVGRLYIADTTGHRLHAYDQDGKHLYRLDIYGGLKYPNEVIWLGDDQLLVVDTNHHRIIVVQDEGNGRSRVLHEMAVKNDLGHGNTWPTAAARDGKGNTWVINSDGLLDNGELIVYDVAGKAQRHIDLGKGADPIVLAPLAGAILVADYDNYRLQRIDTDDDRVEAFGDSTLRDALQILQARRDYWQLMHHLSIGMMVLFGLLGALAAYFDWKARRAQVADQRQPSVIQQKDGSAQQSVLAAAAQLALRPDARGIIWLDPSRRILRWQQAIFVLSVVMLVIGAALMYRAFEDLPAKLIALTGGTTLMILGLNGWLAQSMKRLRIGTDGNILHVVDIFGRKGQGLPEAFIHTGRRLHLGRIAVPLPNPRISIFDKQAFAAVIEPMLERTQRSNEWAILWRNLRQGDLLTWAGVGALIAAIALKLWLDP